MNKKPEPNRLNLPRICTVGSDGTIFFWDVFRNGNKRNGECLATPLHFTAGVTFGDRSKAYVSLPEKTIREFVIVPPVDSVIPKEPREIDLGCFVSVMTVDHVKKFLFVATAEDDVPNSIYSFLTLPQLSGTFEKATIHAGCVTCMALSHDGNFIYSGDDHLHTTDEYSKS